MQRALALHPDSRCTAVTGIAVEAARPRPGALDLRFVVTGRIADLRMPRVSLPGRADGLWWRTCFEAFVRASQGTPYYEFNFAPSTRWAAYRFDDYRGGMRVAREIRTPRIDVRSDSGRFELQASLPLDRLPGLPGGAAWRLGLSAVIVEMGGDVSYWALAHQPGEADFHHSDCFALELPAA